MTGVTVGPSDFIRPPYRTCHHCERLGFGIWVIGRDRYSRKCRDCFHEGPSVSLPDLDKKVIYLDQFAISNMMKASNPNRNTRNSGALDPFYSQLLMMIKRLTQMQLIVCPSSFTHTWESLASPFFESLETFYDMLSYGIKFYDAHSIRRFQLEDHAKHWLRGEPDRPPELDVQAVLIGSKDAWPPNLRVKFNARYNDRAIEELVRWRNEVHQGLCQVFRRWATERHKTYRDWFEEELKSF